MPEKEMEIIFVTPPQWIHKWNVDPLPPFEVEYFSWPRLKLPSPPPQLINNDRPLISHAKIFYSQVYFEQCEEFAFMLPMKLVWNVYVTRVWQMRSKSMTNSCELITCFLCIRHCIKWLKEHFNGNHSLTNATRWFHYQTILSVWMRNKIFNALWLDTLTFNIRGYFGQMPQKQQLSRVQ